MFTALQRAHNDCKIQKVLATLRLVRTYNDETLPCPWRAG